MTDQLSEVLAEAVGKLKTAEVLAEQEQAESQIYSEQHPVGPIRSAYEAATQAIAAVANYRRLLHQSSER